MTDKLAATPSDKAKDDQIALLAAEVARLNAELLKAQPPDEPDQALLISMACCLNHGFIQDNKERQESQLYDMRKLWDETAGRGYYKPWNRGRYLSMLNDENHKSSMDILRDFFDAANTTPHPEG